MEINVQKKSPEKLIKTSKILQNQVKYDSISNIQKVVIFSKFENKILEKNQ